MQTLFALMYPLKWQQVYIPVVPGSMSSFIGSIWPYAAGIHSDAVCMVANLSSTFISSSTHLSSLRMSHLAQLSSTWTMARSIFLLTSNCQSYQVFFQQSIVVFDYSKNSTASITKHFIDNFFTYTLHYEFESPAQATFDAEYNHDSRLRHDLQFQAYIRGLFLDIAVMMFGNIREFILFDSNPTVKKPSFRNRFF